MKARSRSRSPLCAAARVAQRQSQPQRSGQSSAEITPAPQPQRIRVPAAQQPQPPRSEIQRAEVKTASTALALPSVTATPAPAPGDVPDWLSDVFEPPATTPAPAAYAGIEILFPGTLFNRVSGRKVRETAKCPVTIGLDGPPEMAGKAVLGPGTPQVLEEARVIFLNHVIDRVMVMPKPPEFPGGSPFNLPQRVLDNNEMYLFNVLNVQLPPTAPPRPPTPTPQTPQVVATSSTGKGTVKKDPTVTAPTDDIPSRVIVLMNLVVSGEVDEDLQEEISDEAGKYGTLVKCTIKDNAWTVRVFLEYERVADAQKAFADFNGRFFDGRTVKAKYFDAEAYMNDNL